MGDNTTKVIRGITNTPIYVPDGKGEIDMCKAVKDLMDASKTEGIAEGIAEGIKKWLLKCTKMVTALRKLLQRQRFRWIRSKNGLIWQDKERMVD